MKKILLLTSFVLFVGIIKSSAQITLTQSDIGSIGDTVLIGHDTLPGNISVGGTGLQSWDFSSLQLDVLDENVFIDPATTYSDSVFPNSTIAVDVNGGAQINYGTVNSNYFTLDGFWGDPIGFGLPVAIPFNPVSKRLVFPSALNSSFQDTSHFDFYFSDPILLQYGVDSIWISHTSYATRTMDAYGQLITPADTFDCLRQLSVDIAIDTIFWHFALGGGWSVVPASFIPPDLGFDTNPNVDTSYTYLWFANGEGMQVAEATVDAIGGTVLSASFKISDKVVAGLFASVNTSCKGMCDGSSAVNAVSGYAPYNYLWDASAANQNTQMADSLCAGTYSVTITDAMGNQSSASVTITELTYNASVTGAQCDTCATGSATIAISGGATPFTYSWSNGGNTESISNILPGPYSVTVTDNNGCTIVETVFIYTVGINESGITAQLFNVFPNPSNGSFIVTTNDNNLKTIVVYNVMGETIFTSGEYESKVEIDLSGIADGIYFLKVENENFFETKRIIVQR